VAGHPAEARFELRRHQSSWPGKSAKRVFAKMTRPSTTFFGKQDVDARHKAGHDEEKDGRPGAIPAFLFVIASEAKQSRTAKQDWIASSLRSSQ
jgi:hypothetical protein